MIVETATVQSVGTSGVNVVTNKKSGCHQCKSADTCSTSILANYFGNKQMDLKLQTELTLHVGDSVDIGLDEQVFLKLTLLMYLLPLFALILSAVLGEVLATFLLIENELLTISFAALGFITSLMLLKRFKSSWLNPQKLHPVILKKV
jgi:sigma-E factor negative regulatory protein RseC